MALHFVAQIQKESSQLHLSRVIVGAEISFPNEDGLTFGRFTTTSATFLVRSFQIRPEIVIHESIDDRIHKTIGHCQPMDDNVQNGQRSAMVFDQRRIVVQDHGKDVNREPATSEEKHNSHQHLDNLNFCSDC